MQEEVWKDVVGFEQYFKVSNLGRVYTKRSNKILKLHKCKIITGFSQQDLVEETLKRILSEFTGLLLKHFWNLHRKN